MKISLVPKQEKSVVEKIKSGDYQDASEVIRDSLRRRKEREEAVVEWDWREHEILEGLNAPTFPGARDFGNNCEKNST